VLQRQGLAAWLRAWEGLSSAVTRPTSMLPPEVPAGSVASDMVVAVLASMTLACVRVGGTA
jgi:hypothetical protein